ncbi:XdhC family protein [Microvirga sp. STS02]|uniref:XdhC family protein n=1 Tax=Hymenobacter negativus TaxID=2795026 RepID=UPI0018DD18B6|nr:MULTISPECIES: XdhC/CoxI family protein [Bacteria]MBH8567881.1 XdhC family protein [Hymenobacter negativus]MBR7207617.1 XdhC family protein [Microvirga sp. STS02]
MPAAPRDLPVWTLAAASLRAGTPVALLAVLRSEGSSPGRQGFKMAVTADTVAGSIGGGIMEHKFVELARQRLQTCDATPLLRPQIHRREAPADRSGMMCSGEQDVLLWPLTAGDLAAVAAIENSLQTLSGGFLELSPAGGLRFGPTTVVSEAAAARDAASADFYSYQPGAAWHYRERLGFRDQLTIVGGGHVSLALSNVAAALDFELTVLDDRPDLPTLESNQAAHHRRVIDYEKVAAEMPASPHQYVVVMTVGYRTDAVVLRHLLGRSFRYLGVMGSVAKIAELRRGLREEGFSEAEIARLRGPIGLPIQSQTPEEIAISIAAELIQVRRA